jgi:nucleoid-associated protein YgaU
MPKENTLAKLTIIPLKNDVDLSEEPKAKHVEAMFNPGEFTIETRNQFQRTAIPGMPTPLTQFVSGETQTISLELFFDTYEETPKTDVRDFTGKIINLLKINKEIHGPPVCKFLWGGSVAGDRSEFKGVIDSVSQKFTMFLEDGTPVRARLSLSISEYERLPDQLKEIKLRSADRTKHRVFKLGDSLWQMAHKEYSDPGQWRVIAEANDIDNPRLVEPGTELTLPPLE